MLHPNQPVDSSVCLTEPSSVDSADMTHRKCTEYKFPGKALLLLVVCICCVITLGNHMVGYSAVLFDMRGDWSNFSLIGKVGEAQWSDNHTVLYQYKWSHNSGLPFQVDT